MAVGCRRTNWDEYLENMLADPGFAREYERAGRRMDIAIQICRLRDEKRMSLEEVAEAAEVPVAELKRLEEAEEDYPDLNALQRIVKALGASLVVQVVPEEDVATPPGEVKVA